MRPVITIILVIVIAFTIAYFLRSEKSANPREGLFVDAYVELMLLSARSDSSSQAYITQRDSILAKFALTDSSLMALKRELNSDPDHLIEIWDLIELRLKARRDSLGLPSGIDTTKE
ncbi:MAG: hypothetical protein WBP29_01410 [Candidatus Zixiibacteriota bacterium]